MTEADLNDYYLDVLGQQPLLNTYTQICLCFAVPKASSHIAIIDTLTKGLRRLSASFPWIAGQVVNEGASEDNSGQFKIKPLERNPRLIVRDLQDDPSIPTMDILRHAKFPFSMLDETIIAPRRTIPGTSGEPAPESTPVFLVQATFVTGGLLLTFNAAHNTMDMTGQGQIIHLISQACHNESFTREALSSGNLTRGNLVPLLDKSYKIGAELDHQITKPSSSQLASNESNGPIPPPPPNCMWTFVTFNNTALKALKTLATQTITLPGGYISTDDALSAFIWQRITRARLPRLDPTAKSTFARAVDVRRYLNVPQSYPGLLQNMTYHTYALQELVKEPLGSIASNLRSAVDPKTSTLAHDTRALVTLMDRAKDKSIFNITATLDYSVDLMLSSWAKINCYDLDFNLGLGKPEAVRRPRFIPVESLIYLMPKALDGEIAVGMCLRHEDMERLKADKEFMRYGTYIG